jgi:hypothetical protein
METEMEMAVVYLLLHPQIVIKRHYYCVIRRSMITISMEIQGIRRIARE